MVRLHLTLRPHAGLAHDPWGTHCIFHTVRLVRMQPGRLVHQPGDVGVVLLGLHEICVQGTVIRFYRVLARCSVQSCMLP